MPDIELPIDAELAGLLLENPALKDDGNFSPEEIDILHALMGARTAQQCNELFWMAIRRFGADRYACGEIDVKRRERAVFYAIQWSEAWRRFYLENLMGRDPMLTALEHLDEPFTVREWRASGKLGGEELAIIDMVVRNGWVDGFVLPVRRNGSHVALVSIACKQLIAAADKRFLTHASFCYLKRIKNVIEPADFPAPPMGMAPRELECLGLVARGLGDRKIAEKLGISVATAHEHVQRAMKRIGVTSRAEAVALAVSFGAIRI